MPKDLQPCFLLFFPLECEFRERPNAKLPFPVASASPSIAHQEIIEQTWRSARHKQPLLRVMNSLFVIYQMHFHPFSSYSHD